MVLVNLKTLEKQHPQQKSMGAFGKFQEGTTTVKTDEEPSTSFAVPKTKNKNPKRKFEDDLMQLAAYRETKRISKLGFVV
ncbi:hypothetical protein EVAR_88756_1 [Eumeta japonica]|uniref:Uncharacterized protein n=1 Tax=Eumeta variegata TaxID=151549 RepID=A0A4C1XTU2_EUMVA|nr:hypothetical protein EVAR_88756_1 [Eumeta japonica]